MSLGGLEAWYARLSCLGTLLNIGCSMLAEAAPFQPERSLIQGRLGPLLSGAIFLRPQLL